MVEYIYNAIRATAGEDITITARITYDNGDSITSDCHVMLFDNEELLTTVDGTFDATEEVWEFTIPAEATKHLSGRYWYRICSKLGSLCFKEPIYLI
jgi:hypothetical protein